MAGKTATKNAPAATQDKAPALDFTSLSVSDVEVPKQSRASKYANSPFKDWLAESHANGMGKSVTVPEAQADQVVYFVRAAANALGIGAKIVRQPANDKGNVTIVFAGKDRRGYTRRDENAAK